MLSQCFKRLSHVLIIVSLCFSASIVFAAQNSDQATTTTPTVTADSTHPMLGYWQRLNSDTSKPVVTIQTKIDQNNVLSGTIVAISGGQSTANNPPAALNSVMLKDFKLVGSDMRKGIVINPKNGKPLAGELRLAKDGKGLVLKVKKGMFSRTINWKAVAAPSH